MTGKHLKSTTDDNEEAMDSENAQSVGNVVTRPGTAALGEDTSEVLQLWYICYIQYRNIIV